MSKLRHWKERWDRNAPLYFLKRLRLLDGTVVPGDLVTDAHREKLGLHRLRHWHNGGIVAHNIPVGRLQRDRTRDEETATEYPIVEKSKGSWYEVTVSADDVRKVNGKKALTSLLDSLKESSSV